VNRVPGDAIRVQSAVLRDVVSTLAQRAGVGEEQATLLADLLISNDLRGVFSHGSRQIKDYARLFLLKLSDLLLELNLSLEWSTNPWE
jgi:hypothetical protein